MDENEKTIIVDGIELPVDTYFDAEEEEDVRRILYDWSCYDKYVSMCIIDFENETVNETDYVEDNKTDYDTDDYGDKCGEAEEAVEEEYRDEFFWNEGRFGENPLDALIRKERDAAMLAAMTDKQREVFLLYYKEGYTQQQIADMLGCVVSMVNKHLKASLKRIKKFF